MRENYIKYVNLAKKLINRYGTEIEIVCGVDSNDEDDPFVPDSDKVVTYKTIGVIMPPVRGIYFQGTRFGLHATMEDGLFDDKMSCFVLPVYDTDGTVIDLSTATHVVGETVDGKSSQRYKVYFCDTMKPAKKVIMFSYGVGR